MVIKGKKHSEARTKDSLETGRQGKKKKKDEETSKI